MNLPNRLTLIRAGLAPVFLILIYPDNFWMRLAALLVFIGAGITDLVDGHIARKRNLITPFGVFLDPVADKLIVAAALVSFVEIPALRIPAWMVVLLLGREFLITGFRAYAASQGLTIAADKGGKFKTSMQTTAIIIALVFLLFYGALWQFWGMTFIGFLSEIGGRSYVWVSWVPSVFLALTTAITVWTGVRYIYNNRSILTGGSPL